MALINCPECGKENVSDQADMCPNCGFGIKTYFEKMIQEEQNQREMNEKRQTRLESITIPNKPKISRVFIIIMIIIFIALTWLFLYAPIKLGGEGDVGSWLIEVCLIIGAPVYIYSRIYKDRVRKYEISLTDFNNYKEIILKEQDEAIERQRAIEARKIKCPNCGSTNTSAISTLNRAVSVATVGLASSKIGKTMQCKKCGYKW